MFKLFQSSKYTKAEARKFREAQESSVDPVIQFPRNPKKPHYILRPGSDWISDHLIKDGHWEEDLIKFASGFINENSNVLDIGANIGVWSVELSKVVQKGTVNCFEPQKETFKNMCGNLFINGCSNVHAHNVGLGRHEQNNTTALIQIDQENNGGSTIRDGMTTGEKITIRSLDSFDLPKIDLIKMDVEGYEINVLAGGEKLIERDRPVIFFEVWGDLTSEQKSELFNWFTEHGYDFIKFQGADYYAIPRSDYQPKQIDNSTKGLPQKELTKNNKMLIFILMSVFGTLALSGVGVALLVHKRNSRQKR